MCFINMSFNHSIRNPLQLHFIDKLLYTKRRLNRALKNDSVSPILHSNNTSYWGLRLDLCILGNDLAKVIDAPTSNGQFYLVEYFRNPRRC